MFRNLLGRLFSDPAPGPARHDHLSADDAELALAALLVRIARADDHYDAAEKRRIEAVLARRQALGPAEATARRGAAEMIEAEAPDTVRFTRTLKERIPIEDRRDVIAATIAAGADSVEAVGAACKAGTNCGSCIPEIRKMLPGQTARAA